MQIEVVHIRVGRLLLIAIRSALQNLLIAISRSAEIDQSWLMLLPPVETDTSVYASANSAG
jgi:hypothetical protein